jgi:hypothetical protein
MFIHSRCSQKCDTRTDTQPASLAPLGMQTLDPDDFVRDVLDLGTELLLTEFMARSCQRNAWAEQQGKAEVTPERTAQYLANGPMP